MIWILVGMVAAAAAAGIGIGCNYDRHPATAAIVWLSLPGAVSLALGIARLLSIGGIPMF